MFTEDDYIQISALQHYIFCPRQCGLIHLEEKWDENAQVVADWLEDLCSTVVTVERPGSSLYKARVDSVEYLEAPPSRKANGREGLWSLVLEVV